MHERIAAWNKILRLHSDTAANKKHIIADNMICFLI